jgi:type VI protein secretion system component Hcp
MRSAAALVLFAIAIIPIAANAAQVKTPPVPAPHVKVQDIHFTKTIDKSSPSLYRSVVNGKHIKTGTITVRK